MHILTAQDFANAKDIKRTPSNVIAFQVEVMERINALEVGEVLGFQPSEWVKKDGAKLASTPKRYIAQFGKSKERDYAVRLDAKGNYIVMRNA